MNTHYICTGGCKGVSDHPGVCQAADCEKHNHELIECHCNDGKHGGFVAKTCNRGHTYAGSDPCPICWPGHYK